MSGARARAVDVEASSDDPPERVAVCARQRGDASLREPRHAALADLLRIEEDSAAARHRGNGHHARRRHWSASATSTQALQLAESVTSEGAPDRARKEPARAVLDRLGRGALMGHAAKQLRTADDASYDRVKRLAHGIGPAGHRAARRGALRRAGRAIAAAAAGNPRPVRRGRPRVGAADDERRQLGGPPHAAFLLREFGGAEGTEGAQPAAGRPEPLVQRRRSRRWC
jgi:hypothetical protein